MAERQAATAFVVYWPALARDMPRLEMARFVMAAESSATVVHFGQSEQRWTAEQAQRVLTAFQAAGYQVEELGEQDLPTQPAPDEDAPGHSQAGTEQPGPENTPSEPGTSATGANLGRAPGRGRAGRRRQ
jgi:hypothetical protein